MKKLRHYNDKYPDLAADKLKKLIIARDALLAAFVEYWELGFYDVVTELRIIEFDLIEAIKPKQDRG